MQNFRYIFASLFLFASVLSCDAGFTLKFGQSGVLTNNFQINGVGNTVGVEVYLAEDSGGTTLVDELLFSAGVKVDFQSGSSIAKVLSTSDIAINSAFDDIFLTTPILQPNQYAGIDAGVDFFSSGLSPDGDNKIYLGTFTFTGQSVGAMTITALDLDPSFDNTLTEFGTVLDDNILANTATITVNSGSINPVPEPSSLALLGMGTIGFLAYCRRRYNARRK